MVVIAIIAILAAILFPVFAQAREKARSTQCLSNLKNVSYALMMYAEDYDEVFVSINNWKQKIDEYVKNKNIDFYPSRPQIKRDNNCFLGQTINLGSVNGAGDGVRGLVDFETGSGVSLAEINNISEKIMLLEWGRVNDGFGDCNAGAPVGEAKLTQKPSCNWAVCSVHNGFVPIVFCDGHTKTMKNTDFHSNVKEIKSDGTFITSDGKQPTAINENIWRKYWDITY